MRAAGAELLKNHPILLKWRVTWLFRCIFSISPGSDLSFLAFHELLSLGVGSLAVDVALQPASRKLEVSLAGINYVLAVVSATEKENLKKADST